MAETVREFFETLPGRVDASKAAGVTGSFLFDVAGAGEWLVDVQNGRVDVTEGARDADVTVTTSEDDFMAVVRGEQNPMTAYMTGKIKVKGDIGKAMSLQKLF